MYKNGFTLVELLSVVVVIALISMIAIPKVTTMIENSRQNAFEISEEMLVKAAERYVELEKVVLPKDIGDSISIDYIDLRDSEYATDFLNPKDHSQCSGSVLIIRVAENKCSYTANMVCGDIENPDYVSSLE